ncbi:hypothetical protein ABDK00_003185 [Niabella insulamsoli]|uniref:hypothetical protein n=1 Tax=Niabella insulamsoli TaxID=3144874 RepID=UPI0031FD791E
MKWMPKLTIAFCAVLVLLSCKKETENNSPDDRFEGLWVESGLKKDTLLVTKPENYSSLGPMLFLHHDGAAAIPFSYRFNSTGDTITLSDLTASSTEGLNVKYKVTLSEKTFSINKFHASLPEGAPLIFNRVR